MICRACGREIASGSKFCSYCGAAVCSTQNAPPALNETPSETDESPINLIVVTDADGKEVTFEFLDLISYRGNDYVVLLPTEEDAQEVVILQVEDAGDQENYVSVEDDETLNTLFEIFKEKFKDFFNFA